MVCYNKLFRIFFPKNCGICCDKVSETFSYECFCQNQRSRKSSSHLSSLKTSFIKTAIVKHLSNFTHFQILSKTSFTSHMFFLICFGRRGTHVMYLYYRLQAMLANLMTTILAKDCFCKMATKAPLDLLVTKHWEVDERIQLKKWMKSCNFNGNIKIVEKDSRVKTCLVH